MVRSLFACLIFLFVCLESRADYKVASFPEVLERTMLRKPKSIATLQQSVDFVAEPQSENWQVELMTKGWTGTCSIMNGPNVLSYEHLKL
jgi:hypothetical protein